MWEGQKPGGLLENAAQRVGKEPAARSNVSPPTLLRTARGTRGCVRRDPAALRGSCPCFPEPVGLSRPGRVPTATCRCCRSRRRCYGAGRHRDPAGGRQAGLRVPRCRTEGRPHRPARAGSALPPAGAPASVAPALRRAESS